MSKPKVPLLLTRPQLSSEAFWRGLPPELSARMKPIISPLLRIEPNAVEVNPDRFDGVILTSAQAVAHLPEPGRWTGKRAFAVGDATARAARKAGLDCESASGDNQDLLALLRKHAVGQRLIHLRGAHSRGDIARTATAAGVETDDAIVYDQIAQPLSAEAHETLNGQHPVIVPLFSPRTAQLYASGGSGLAALYLISISDAVDDACQTCPAHARYVAQTPTAVAMSERIRQALSDIGPLEGGTLHV